MIHRSPDKTTSPLVALLGIFFHGFMLFCVPFVVGGIAGAFLEVSQVAETLDSLGLISFLMLAPVFVVQVVGVGLKTMRELRFLRREGRLSARTLLDATHRNLRILTWRGYFVFFSGVAFVLLALGFLWASLGVVAVVSLLLFYIVTGVSVFLSAFLVKTFEAGVGRNKAGIRREFHPSVIQSGEPVEEQFQLRRVPILPGYFLAIEDKLPERLHTLTRHVIPPKAKRQSTTVRSHVRRTPRGTYEAGPAHIWYQDMLGLTQISVASLATARLKVLPRAGKIDIIDPPRTPLEEPDILTRPKRFPTEDFFRFREYQPGDDTRRIHWRLSMRVGQLQVRLPEAREVNVRKVVLALDTFVPTPWLRRTEIIDDLLDALVEVWISVADELQERGEHVTLVAALPNEHDQIETRKVDCSRTRRTGRLDAGSSAIWQDSHDVASLFDDIQDDTESFMIVLTSRLEAPPAHALPGQKTTWIYLHPRDTVGPEPPSAGQLWLNWQDRAKLSGLEEFLRFVQLPHPAGSDENGLEKRIKHYLRRKRQRDKRAWVHGEIQKASDRAYAALLQRPDTVYRMEVHPGLYRLVGVGKEEKGGEA